MKALFIAKVKLAATASAAVLMLGVGVSLAMDMAEAPGTAAEKKAVGTSKILTFDRAALHAQAVEESLKPIRPGVPGKVPFWNTYATNFIYAPAFDFKPVEGATAYRFTVTAYGSRSWSFEDTSPATSLESVWKDLPEGKVLITLRGQNSKGKWIRSREAARLLEKRAGGAAPTVDFKEMRNAQKYSFTLVRALVFEADVPWAALTPVWKNLPHGLLNLTVEGLDTRGGKRIALAVIGKNKKTARQFERRVAFGGPYHEAAMDYAEAGTRWFTWLQNGSYKKWKREGNPEKLGQYPCKEEAAVVKGATALALLQSDPAKKEALLHMARNAARTLIKGSYPADWGLAFFPPTYGSRRPGPTSYGTVMMTYPASAADAYLDLHEATKEKEFLDAAVRIADVYKRTQLDNGSWPILMEGKTGEKASRSKTFIMPTGVITFLSRLIEDHALESYQPVAQAAWKWIEDDPLRQFRFEGQFEDTGANRGGDFWHVSHHMARRIAMYLLHSRKNDPASVPLAEEIMRWSEDQFLFWEKPETAKQTTFTPYGVEQHRGPLKFSGKGYSTEAGGFLSGWLELYEATGKELYLAKAITLANAMTVLQKTRYGGNYVSTDWDRNTGSGGWVNCHTFNATTFVKLGQLLKERNLRVSVNPDSGAKTE